MVKPAFVSRHAREREHLTIVLCHWGKGTHSLSSEQVDEPSRKQIKQNLEGGLVAV
jgi:hypothetical protein